MVSTGEGVTVPAHLILVKEGCIADDLLTDPAEIVQELPIDLVAGHLTDEAILIPVIRIGEVVTFAGGAEVPPVGSVSYRRAAVAFPAQVGRVPCPPGCREVAQLRVPDQVVCLSPAFVVAGRGICARVWWWRRCLRWRRWCVRDAALDVLASWARPIGL